MGCVANPNRQDDDWNHPVSRQFENGLPQSDKLFYARKVQIPIWVKNQQGEIKTRHNTRFNVTEPRYTNSAKLDFMCRDIYGSTCVLPGQDPHGSIKKQCQDDCIFMVKNNILLVALFDGHGENGQVVSRNWIESTKTIFNEFQLEGDPNEWLKYLCNTCHDNLVSSTIDISISGSTAVFVLIIEGVMYSASVGDSRAIVASGDPPQELPVHQDAVKSFDAAMFDDIKIRREAKPEKQLTAIQLTQDQKPDDLEERIRINKAGGRVARIKNQSGKEIGPYRVWSKKHQVPGLAMSRSLGDRIGKRLGIIPDPITTKLDNEFESNYFLVLGSDGIWDVMENQEVINFVETYRKSSKKEFEKLITGVKIQPQSTCIAHLLWEEARARWFVLVENEDVIIDDISAVVIEFQVTNEGQEFDNQYEPRSPQRNDERGERGKNGEEPIRGSVFEKLQLIIPSQSPLNSLILYPIPKPNPYLIPCVSGRRSIIMLSSPPAIAGYDIFRASCVMISQCFASIIKMKRLEQQFSCPVCLECLQDPVILSCSHNICFKCVKYLIGMAGLHQTSKLTLSCPVCRRPTYFPSGGPESLQKNITLKNIIEEYKMYEKQSSTDIVCGLCVDTPAKALFEWLACDLQCCEDCARAHNAKPKFQHHKIISIVDTKLPVLCPDHHKELELFWMNWQVLCWFVWAQYAVLHKGHNLLTLVDAKIELGDEIGERRSQIKTLNTKIDSYIETQAQETQILMGSRNAAQEKVNTQLNEVRAALDTLEQRIHSEIDEEYQTKEGQAKERLDHLNLLQHRTHEIEKIDDDLTFVSRSLNVMDLNFEDANPSEEASHISFGNVQGVIEAIDELAWISNQNEWQAPMHLYYLSRGTKEWLQYNLENKECEVLSIMSGEIIPRWSGFVVLDDRILVTGGKDSKESGANNHAFYFLPATGDCIQLPSMIHGHSSHLSIRITDLVYIIAGKNQSNTTSTNWETFDIKSQQWQEIAPMNAGRTCCSGAHTGENIFILGGYQLAVDNTIERYSIPEDEWKWLNVTLPDKIWQHSCILVSEGQILICGGESAGDEPHRMSYIFDTEQEIFHSFATIPAHSHWLFFWLHVRRSGNAIYSINKERMILKYNIASNSWLIYR